MIISRVAKGPIIAATTAIKKDGSEWTLWSKAMPVYDMQGNFIASVGIVRDVTATFKDIMINDETQNAVENKAEAASRQTSKPAGLFSKILNKSSGKSSSYYKEGMNLYTKEKNIPKHLLLSIRHWKLMINFPMYGMTAASVTGK